MGGERFGVLGRCVGVVVRDPGINYYQLPTKERRGKRSLRLQEYLRGTLIGTPSPR
jgi:chemotaxis receptor (MCP) glutamine deamidase CheD